MVYELLNIILKYIIDTEQINTSIDEIFVLRCFNDQLILLYDDYENRDHPEYCVICCISSNNEISTNPIYNPNRVYFKPYDVEKFENVTDLFTTILECSEEEVIAKLEKIILEFI